jgi:hypothetical protein
MVDSKGSQNGCHKQNQWIGASVPTRASRHVEAFLPRTGRSRLHASFRCQAEQCGQGKDSPGREPQCGSSSHRAVALLYLGCPLYDLRNSGVMHGFQSSSGTDRYRMVEDGIRPGVTSNLCRLFLDGGDSWKERVGATVMNSPPLEFLTC